MTEAAAPSPSLKELASASFRVGCLGFGGPAGQIALMHRVFVEEKRWIGEAEYLHALNYCMLLPGPEAQQLATYAGWRLRSVTGGVIAGLLFVLPGALIVFALTWLYAAWGTLPVVAALFYGVKAAVIGFILEALVKVGRRALKGPQDIALAAAAFLGLFLFQMPFPLVIGLAAAIGLIRSLSQPRPATAALPIPAEKASAARALKAAASWGALWFAPLIAAMVMLGPDHVLTKVGVFFSKLAVLTFGGAYTVLAYLQQQAVEAEGWLTAPQMIDGLGLAETTPGPLVLVNQFVGFMAGWQTEGGGLWLAAAAALMASWCTFAPSFVWIFAGAPFSEGLRRSRAAAGILQAITAAVFGIIAKVAAVFGMAVLFRGAINTPLPWGSHLSLPDLTQPDLLAMVIAAGAAIALIRYKVNIVLVVLGCALAGLLSLWM
ncbi:putative chromate ion transporter [Hyphomonas polymorpha PS728]|uniref:Putative chromate ion transporter n=1 Tax=Hyphomonas polymorpha PS728 TaxID=1280954 RepID=A0A062VPN9_9PROT|nr:chromate efflux transporter [Hyphomonas polymorpha]KDA00251.1 putative chromate ion transporter [Hyphomonas polymorpha PS728]